MIKRLGYIALVFSAVFLMSASAKAQDVEIIDTFDDWTAYSFQEKSGKVCYIASTPVKDEGKYTRRGDIFTIVTHRPAEKSFDVVSVVAGYTYLKNSQVKVSIGTKEFSMFTHDNTAWAHNSSTDKGIVKAMVNGNKMIVRGTSSRKTKTKDTYSLKGFTAAHRAINKACNKK